MNKYASNLKILFKQNNNIIFVFLSSDLAVIAKLFMFMKENCYEFIVLYRYCTVLSDLAVVFIIRAFKTLKFSAALRLLYLHRKLNLFLYCHCFYP